MQHKRVVYIFRPQTFSPSAYPIGYAELSIDTEIVISHSKNQSEEVSRKIVVDAAVQIGEHFYSSNWAVVDARYDVLLGMPWYATVNPAIDYEERTVTVHGKQLHFIVEPESNVEISSIGVKKFRSLLRKKSHHPELQFFGLVSCNNTTATKPKKRNNYFCLSSLLEKYESVFREELPDGLSPKRTVDHEIVTDPNAKPPLRPLYQLSPAEMVAAKSYVTNLLRQKK